MAQMLVDGVEGSETGRTADANFVGNIKQWLNSNDLHALEEYFEAEKTTMEELLQYSAGHIESIFGSDMVKANNPDFLYPVKFMKALEALQSQTPSGPRPTLRDTPSVQLVVISEKEEELMGQMQSTLTKIDEALERNAANQAELILKSERIGEQIDDTFGECLSMLTQRIMSLKQTLTATINAQSEALVQQQDALRASKQSVQNGLAEHQAMITDSAFDRKKRELQMSVIAETVLGAMDEELLTSTVQELEASFDLPAISENIQHFGCISERHVPPSLDIVNITSSQATVRLHSEHDKEAVRYSFRYRRGAVHGDDEKESDWIEHVLDADQVELRGLTQGSSYHLQGRYQFLANKAWSGMSQTVSFVTPIMAVTQFEWDPDRKHGDIALSNSNTKMKRKRMTSWRTAVTKQMLSGDTLSSVSWEAKILDVRDDKKIRMMIGFVDSTAVDGVRMDTYLGKKDRPKECVLYISTDSFAKYQRSSMSAFDSKWKGSKCNDEDRILMTFDFVNSRCTASYNGETIGVISESLPQSIYLAVSVGFNQSLETVKFECVPRFFD